jgi:hypothetical protein
MTTVYVSIGNSDGNLSPTEWSAYCTRVGNLLTGSGFADAVHGVWFSPPASPYVNACWCVEIAPQYERDVKQNLRRLAAKFRQDSIVWAVAATEFLTPTDPDPEPAAAEVRR